MSEKNKGYDLPEERPLECGECKKPIAVRYTEVVGNVITHTVMCSECPQLQHRLHGIPSPQLSEQATAAGLACGNCGTTLDSIRMGNPVGCSSCYEVFEDEIIHEMLVSNKLPPKLAGVKKTVPIHVGRSPGEIKELTPSLRLLALTEALNETIRREDYEQAAWLRDQITELTEHEKTNDGK